MNLLEEIESSPETIEQDKLNALFDRALKELPTNTLKEKEFVSEVLYELSDKQWHNYKKLEQNILDKVDQFVIDILSDELSLKIIENISGVIVRLGLSESFAFFKTLINKENLSKEILEEIIASIKEYGNSVDDPYKRPDI